MALPCKAFAASWIVKSVLLSWLLVTLAHAGEEEALAADDECGAGDSRCALNALQHRGTARADPEKEVQTSAEGFPGVVSGYQRFPHWNCYKAGAPSSDGYVGIVGVSTCAELCTYKYSCTGFVYMNSQSKCWLRDSGYSCYYDSTGEAASFDYYQKGSQ
mmetsp:Transcript_36159/g.72803  ORF Transcript_36159/g.72803 Transcript_36159/m.72803 type:complete len:160 (-) Transcript_36159:216-695(-)